MPVPGYQDAEELARGALFTLCRASRPGHLGIGLVIARKLVLAGGGRIEVTANRPRGALFRIEWPKPRA